MTRPTKNYYCYPCGRGTRFSESFHRYKEGEIPIRKGKYPVPRTNTKPHELIKHAKNFLLYSFTCIPQFFVHHLPKWSKLSYLKAEAFQVPQKLWTELVWYLLLGIRTSVYSCTVCGTSKIYLCLEDNRSSLSRVSLKSETKDACPETVVLFYFFCFFVFALFYLRKICFSENKNLTSNSWRWTNLHLTLKQLKMNKFIKSISKWIISTSNATLEVLSLRPCFLNSRLVFHWYRVNSEEDGDTNFNILTAITNWIKHVLEVML